MSDGKVKLWTKNFTLLTLASAIGSAGGIAGSFALSFFVFDETGSTFASALVIAVQLVPHVFVPLFAAPLMDRLPRKAFLVGGDLGNGIIYAAMGVWLLFGEFSYTGYLLISMILAMLASVDHLAYASIYPSVIPEGAEQRGYAVSYMLYPILNVVMMPVGALLLDLIGVPLLLIIQGAMSVLAAFTESFIRDVSEPGAGVKGYGVREWAGDIKEAVLYLKKEKGLRSMFEYVALSSGFTRGYSPLLVAFFRTAPGLSAAMYSFFSAADFLGRTAAGALRYGVDVEKDKKHRAHSLYAFSGELLNMSLLWLPYPLMLVNRALSGFCENGKGILMSSAVQLYIPENLRARINGFNNTFITAVGSLLALLVGALGELMDYRICVSVLSALSMFFCWLLTVRKNRGAAEVFAGRQDAGE